MFLAKWEENGKEEYYIYYKKNGGYRQFLTDTFSPLIEKLETLDFKISGYNYKERKENLEELAIEYSLNYASLSWSYVELAEIYNFFYKNGKRYGLLKEFKENAIC